MTEAQSPDSLDAHVDQAVRTITAVVAATALDLQPMLHLVGPNDVVSVAVLAGTGGGEDIACGARWVVNEQQPHHAILLSVSLAAAPAVAPARDVDAAVSNEGATQFGCAAKLPSLGFALLHEVSRVRRLLYQPHRHKTRHRLDSVTPIGDPGAVRRLPSLPGPVPAS